MLKIGDFSKVAQVSVKTLRYYAELGLLQPAWVDRYSGYRYYALEQLPRLNRILALKELGFSLVQIESLLRDDLPAGELQRLMALRHAELQQQLQAEQARLLRVEQRLAQIAQEGKLPRYEVLVKRVEPMLVAGIRERVSAPGEVGRLAMQLRSYLQGRGLPASGRTGLMTVYHDAEFEENGADVEVAAPLERTLKGSGSIVVHELPGLECAASVLHQGSYEGMQGAYRALAGWTEANGYLPAGPNRELYLQGPEADVRPPSFITEVQLPIRRAARPAAPQGTREGQAMEPRIVTKEAFTVVGVPFSGQTTSGPYEDGQNNNEIGQAWDQFNRRANEIRNISGPAIGLCFAMPRNDAPWYIAGIEVSRAEDVPAGMMSMDVPTGRYAVFSCKLPELSETYRRIMEEWQPTSGHERRDGMDFELYDEQFDPADPTHGLMYVYWPIK